MEKDWSNYRLVAIAPVLAVLILFASYVSVTHSFFCKPQKCEDAFSARLWNVLEIEQQVVADPCTTSPTPASEDQVKDAKTRQRAALKTTGLMTWNFIAMVYVFVCLAALAVSFILTSQLLHRSLMGPLIVIGLSSGIGILLYTHPEWHMPIFTALFKGTICHDVPTIVRNTNFLNCLGNTAAFSILLTSCATLLLPYRQAPLEINQLSRRMKYLRTILYVGTLLLVVAVLLKKSLYHWSLAYTSQDESLAKIASSFLSNILTMEGGFYTLVLAAVYLPAAVVLHRRARLLPTLPEEEPKKDEVLKQYGLSFSFTESLPRILAILGPLLVGPVGELLSHSF